MDLEKNWEEIKYSLMEKYDVTEVSYEAWIKNLSLGSVENGKVIIYVPSENSISLRYLTKNYTGIMSAAISEATNSICNVEFVLEPENAGEKVRDSLTDQAAERANLNSKYTFNTFVVGPNNRFAQSASLAVAENPGQVYNPLYIYGGAGLGKTHLMHSIGHFILERNPDNRVMYVDSETFTHEVIASIRSGNAQSIDKLREKYRSVDVLLIDDIQFIIGKESTQEEFFHTFNALHNAGKQVVLSSDRPPKELETLDERFRSRFEWGLIADIQPPDYETRMAILGKNLERLGIDDNEETEDVLKYIAENIKTNIRELEGALNKIVAFKRLNNTPFTVETAKDALKDIIISDAPRQVTPEFIIDIVCSYYSVEKDELFSKKRDQRVRQPRQIAMYLIRRMTDTTLQGIGKLFNKDHTTVMHSIDIIEESINGQNVNNELKNQIDILRNKINLEK
ncbi:MAG: chromosomal replication initiator protein DnaA [Lachnospiraceae bacterium]|nr:chromosomal replication initiator protein DnaA [Lachnospiraceae bacterium]